MRVLLVCDLFFASDEHLEVHADSIHFYRLLAKSFVHAQFMHHVAFQYIAFEAYQIAGSLAM